MEKTVIIANQQEINKRVRKGLPIRKQSIHKTKGYDEAGALTGTKGNNTRIMVVDDDEGIRNILSTGLSGMGYDVLVASNGIEAFNLFLKSSFGLVLTDLEMPGMDGLNLASRIKDKFFDIPVVLMTGQAKEVVMKKIKGSSVDYVIFKPFRLEDILKTTKKLLGAESSEMTHKLL